MGKVVGEVVIGIGLLTIFTGIVGIIRFTKFRHRILICTLSDTVGTAVVLLGIMIRQGMGFFSLKTGIILLAMLIVNPLIAHRLASIACGNERDREVK